MASTEDGSAAVPRAMNLLDLPVEILEEIFEYLCYDEIAKKRIICKKVDQVSQSLLNRGFLKMIKRHNANLKAIKMQLPRRESERRNHPLAKHSDILTCIETRISMLSMTYSKYVDKDLCCFIPGKVIDEVFNILKLIEGTSKPLRAHEVLQELRDISSMAIEHFDENIAHRLKRIMGVQHHPGGSHLPFPTPGFIQNEVVLPCDVNGEKLILPTLTPISPHKVVLPSTSSSSVQQQQQQCHTLPGSPSACSGSRINQASIARVTHKSRKMRLTINKMIAAIQGDRNQMKQLRSQVMRNSLEIRDLRRRLEESETKNRELLANISKAGAGGGPGSSVTAEPVAAHRNIKPRSATIILKRILSETQAQDGDAETSAAGSSKKSKLADRD